MVWGWQMGCGWALNVLCIINVYHNVYVHVLRIERKLNLAYIPATTTTTGLNIIWYKGNHAKRALK